MTTFWTIWERFGVENGPNIGLQTRLFRPPRSRGIAGTKNQRKLGDFGPLGSFISRTFSRHARPLSRNAAALTNFTKHEILLVFTVRGACPPFPRNPRKPNDGRKKGPDNDPKTLQKTSAGDAPNTDEQIAENGSKIVQKSTPNGLFFKLPAGPPPRAPRRRQKAPLGAPKDAPREPKDGPRAPQKAPGPPPGRPKMAQNATREFKVTPLGPPGRPKSRPRGLRRPFWGDFRPPGTWFCNFSGLLFRRSLPLFLCDVRLTPRLGTPNKAQHPRNPRDSIRRAGGVIPTWSRGGSGRPFWKIRFGGLAREPQEALC